MSRGQAGNSMGGSPAGARSGSREGPISSAERRQKLSAMMSGDFSSAANALEQESRGRYFISQDVLRTLSAWSAMSAMENDAHMVTANGASLELGIKFGQAGLGRTWEGTKIGSQRENTEHLNAAIKSFLISKPLTDRTEMELQYLGDMFGQLGVTIGENPESLNNAITNYLSSVPMLDQMLKGGNRAQAFVYKQ